jgi:hypothetical protein
MISSVYKIVVNRAALHLELFKNDAVLLRAPVCVGGPTSPTPAGTFFVSKIITRDSWLHRWYRRNRIRLPWLSRLAQIIKNLPFIYNRLQGKADAVGELVIVLRNYQGQYVLPGIHGGLDDFIVPAARTHGCVQLNYDDLVQLRNLPLNTAVIIK